MVSTKEILSKEYGDGVMTSGAHLINRPKKRVSISPSIDLGLKFIEEGTLTLLVGIEKSGKTLMALDIASQFQKEENGSRPVFYFNIEGRINQKTLEGIKDLDLSNFNVIESTQSKILSGEEYLDIAIKLIELEKNGVFIIDSFSNLCLAAEFSSKMSDSMQMAASAKLLARFCRRVCNILPVNNSVVIGINHLIGNPGYGSPVQEAGGKALKYQADNKLLCKKFEYWKQPANSENVIGLISNWEIVHSSMGFPNKKITSYIRFGEGIDRTYELLTIASDLGVILQKGAGWLVFPADGTIITDGEKKIQGLENGRTFLKENPQYESYIANRVKEMWGG